MKLFLLLFSIISLFPSPVFRANTLELRGEIIWQDEGHTDMRPSPKDLQLVLYQDGKPYSGGTFSFTSTTQNRWTFLYSKLPANHQYTVRETPPEGYSVETTQAAQSLYVATFARITPNNRLTIPLSNANYIVAIKGNSAVVWTLDALTQEQRNLFVKEIERVGEAAFSKLSNKKLTFISGLPSSDKSGISLEKDDDDLIVKFSRPRDWSQVGYGTYSLSLSGLTIVNTYDNNTTTAKPTSAPTNKPANSPSPTPVVTDEPTSSPSPTPVVTDEPENSPSPSAAATDEPPIEPTPKPTTPPIPETGESDSATIGGFILWGGMFALALVCWMVLRAKQR